MTRLVQRHFVLGVRVASEHTVDIDVVLVVEETVIDIASRDLALDEGHVRSRKQRAEGRHQNRRDGHGFPGQHGQDERRGQRGSRDGHVHGRGRAQHHDLQGDGFRQNKVEQPPKGGPGAHERKDVSTTKPTRNGKRNRNQLETAHQKDLEGAVHFESDEPRRGPDVWQVLGRSHGRNDLDFFLAPKGGVGNEQADDHDKDDPQPGPVHGPGIVQQVQFPKERHVLPVKGRKKVGQQGPVQSQKRPQHDLQRLALQNPRVGERGKVPDGPDGLPQQAPKDHETDLAAKDALHQVLKVLDAEPGTDLQRKQGPAQRDPEKGRQGPGHPHKGVLPHHVGGRLPKDAPGHKAAERAADGHQRGLRSQRSAAQYGEHGGKDHRRDVVHGDVGLAVDPGYGVGQIARLAHEHHRQTHQRAHGNAHQRDPRPVVVFRPPGGRDHVRFGQRFPQVLQTEKENRVVQVAGDPADDSNDNGQDDGLGDGSLRQRLGVLEK
mmetsp:Transcript_21223/g.46311  ORF Transcript_21223/g.46311 Transcript_21223/m.46311 type:complete len:491 (-) Transcript_21223:921-2393(-)